MSKLPRKTGYFHEMRSAMPQIIFTGNHELAFDIFLNFRLHSQTASRPDISGQGIFMVRALVRSGVDVDTCIKYILRSVKNRAKIEKYVRAGLRRYIAR